MYFAGILFILAGALLVNRIAGHKNRKSFFIMELPEYKWPSVKRAALSMCSRGWAYVVKAGTIILVCNAVVFLMQSFGWYYQLVENREQSILHSFASPVALLLVPIGAGVWQLAAGAVTGFIAKENVVGTLAVCYGFLVNDDLEMVGSGNEVAAAMVTLTKVSALAYLMFNLFTPPCFAALGAMNAELSDRKWFWGGVALQLGTGFTLGFLVYQIGTLITTGAFGPGFVGGLIAVAAMAAIVVYLCAKADRKWFWGGVALQLATGFTMGYLVYQAGTMIATGSFGPGFLGGLIAVAVFVGIIICLIRKADREAMTGK
jgi:ferrous iron transport protein B